MNDLLTKALEDSTLKFEDVLKHFGRGYQPVRQKLNAVLERARAEKTIKFEDLDETLQDLLGLF